MAEASRETSGRTGRASEVLGIVFIGISLLFGLAMFSYNPADPSWGSASSSGMTANLAGRFGAYLSDALYQLLGGGAFLLPFYTLVYGINRITDKERGHRVLKMSGGALLILSTSVLLRLMYVHLPFGGILAGGLAGELAATGILDIFGRLGAYTLTITAFLGALVISTTFSLLGGLRAGSGIAYVVYDKARTSFLMHSERRRKAKVKEERADVKPEPPPAIIEPEEAAGHPPAVSIQEPLPFQGLAKSYTLPPVTLLANPPESRRKTSRESLLVSANMLEKRIRDFGVEGKVTEVHPGPVVTMYEFEPAPGVKVGKVASLSDDLALAMRAESVRIVAPIPGKAAVGIEIPNNVREEVCMKEILTSPDFRKSRSPLTLALGKDIYGGPVVTDLARMPHLLVAGATGSGKSVAINTMTMSLLMNAKPRDLRLIMVDPKRLELSVYEGIPHLLDEVITEPRRAAAALRRMVVVMEERYKLLAAKGVRNIEGYNVKQINEKAHPKLGADTGKKDEVPPQAIPNEDGTLPYIVVIIDELADLMMVAAKEIEDSIARLAQMARAAGIHLLMATQRPSVDVLTGVIKANFPARMSFQVSSKTDSRTIIDANGAEALLGKGDMLFLPPGASKLMRIHGSYVSEDEIARVVAHLKMQARPAFGLFTAITPPAFEGGKKSSGNYSGEGEGDGRDERYQRAVELVVTAGKASASLLQRRMRIGYPTASRIIEMMEEDGIVGPRQEGGKEREVMRKPADIN
ncbi:MAG TPA: DNA translocase FtsK 4TM domain-containing protein [Nitrospirota bacterium]|jgi:S-DNA-T family DNA segregation ATPase FtsK/SpoIIIE